MNLAPVVDRRQSRNRSRIQALTRKRMDDSQSFLRIVCVLVGAIGSQCIERIRYGDDSRQQRNVIALQSVRIAASVQRLVV